MDNVENFYEGCIMLVLTLAVAIASYFILAYVVGQMWEWYVYPVFEIARPGYAHLVGLSILIAYLTNSRSSAAQVGVKKEKVGPWITFAALFYDAVAAPFIILFVGWLVHFFV